MKKPLIPTYIPYRDSKLTRVLKDSLIDPKCSILLIVTLNPTVSQYDDTFNSLTFANKIKKIKVDLVKRPTTHKLQTKMEPNSQGN